MYNPGFARSPTTVANSSGPVSGFLVHAILSTSIANSGTVSCVMTGIGWARHEVAKNSASERKRGRRTIGVLQPGKRPKIFRLSWRGGQSQNDLGGRRIVQLDLEFHAIVRAHCCGRRAVE